MSFNQYAPAAAPAPGGQQIRFGRLGLALTAAQAGREYYNQARKWWRDRHEYTVVVRSDDNIYDAVHSWLLDQVTESRSTVVRTRSTYGDNESSAYDAPTPVDEDAEEKVRVTLYHNDTSERTFIFKGHRVRVSVTRPDTANAQTAGQAMRFSLSPDEIRFATMNAAGAQAIIDHITQLAEEQARRKKRKPALWIMTQWGDWMKRDDLPIRRLDSVILKEKQAERILDDLVEFLGREKDYARKGIPWHRGYLFHGPPGTGKSSLAKALAAEANLDVYYASLRDLSKDTSVLQLISRVKPRSVLLLEDIDTLQAAHEREGDAEQISMSGILNALDGIVTPHGLVTFMSTNFIDKIDPALIRPGRVDLIEKIDVCDDDQARRLYESFYGVPLNGILCARGRTAAELSEIMKRHMDKPDDGHRAIMEGTL